MSKRDERIAEMEEANRRLECLYEISKLLLRFDSVERTVPAVVTIIAATLPLRSALFILTVDRAQIMAWLPEGEDAQRMEEVKTRAVRAYRYLAHADSGLEDAPARSLGLPRHAPDTEAGSEPGFVMLPLVVGHDPVFGGLQIEGASRLDEPDLIFVNAVVNQLAIGLDRYFADRALRRSETKLAGIITEQKRIEREQRFLARVGPTLATTLEYEETLSKIAELALGDLADFCIVDMVGWDGEVRRLKVLGRDPAKEWVCAALMQLQLDRHGPHLVSAVLETQESVVIDVTAETLAALAQSDEHLHLLRALVPKSVIAVPLRGYDRLLGVLAVISSSRAYGPADLRLAEELAHRGALSIENARLYLAANKAIQVRDDILGVVAHDLRNPLGTITLQAALLRQLYPESERRVRNPADVIERAALRMKRLIQDLLDVTRIEAGHLTVEQRPLSPAQVISDALEAEQPLAVSSAIALQVDLAPDLSEVWADRDRLIQVLENLIGNALKFTQPGGRIVVGAAPRDGEALFWVADTGPGIAAEDVPRVFDRFWQGRKGEKRGAGLGLAIVKGIVDAHGGRIWVASTPDKGSTFFFTIPMAPRAEPRRAENHAER